MVANGFANAGSYILPAQDCAGFFIPSIPGQWGKFSTCPLYRATRTPAKAAKSHPPKLITLAGESVMKNVQKKIRFRYAL